jgi:L-ascorbate metabolism protein UlaG (beta-lactamase superfamily)
MNQFPKHFDGKRFYNPDAPQARGFLDVLRWKRTSTSEPPPKFIPEVKPTVPERQIEGGLLRTTLINHSTVLLQLNGLNILTDPIWSERASPVASVGPRRLRNPGVQQEHLPPIHVVLLSHNHYDHLDLPTLRWLAGRGESIFIVPLGVSDLLRSENIGPAYELDWGQERTAAGMTFHGVPALHFSRRGISDMNKTLWCGFVIKFEERVIYFAGDTGFGEHFAQIREKFGSPRLSLLPIGAYLPEWFMSPIHMSPEAAIRAHGILGSETSIAIHHGTFQLADDGIDTARHTLESSGRPDSFQVLENGQWADIEW